MRTRSLRTRIAVYFAAAMVLALAGMGVAAYAVVRHELGSALDTGLRREATRITRQFAAEPDVATISGPCRYLAAPSCVQVVAADGRIESGHDPDSALPVDDVTRSVATGSAAAYVSDIAYDGQRVRMYTAQLRPGLAVQVAQRSDQVDTGTRRVGLALLAAAVVGTALAIAAGWFAARRALAPVTTLTRAAERVAATRDPSRHIPVTGSDELATLATSFNTMLDALEQALAAERESRAAQRRLVADASHELRTPLTALRANIDLLRRADRLTPDQLAATAAALHGPAGELSGLVADLIDLARADDPRALIEPFEDLRLDTLVAQRVEVARTHWSAVTFETDLEPTTISGAPARLSRAITNLLDNAAKFSPAGETVHIELRARRLTVRDRGPGIPADDLPHIFDRFYRSRTARGKPGHGLGLAIVAQVAAQHGARLTAASEPGGGAVLWIEFD
ncbi:HAMP domain-containing sensor histidine kinase [Nocardia pseudobrasiliensis]|uniref:histidine kinase n=1 Tax=Nocardia pseudobrasiliensis TaxID=45979 RepID=A0A370IDU7_9NOCA|nr:sensor histidine kinase [Nocardia pseudobrasiliensis]RDI68898.1 two-component system sensor histidine kinase MprB [Nocardia pseudobrasiliensis]